jgi:hypothetical protein
MRTVAHHAPAQGVDQCIAVRNSDIIEALVKGGALANEAAREKFRRVCDILAAILHYDYFALLERLRHDYYYFAPEVAPHAAMDGDVIEHAYTDLLQSLDKVLTDANFVELPHDDIADAHAQRTLLRVAVKAPLDDFRAVRFYRRGRHVEQFELRDWFGLRRRKIDAEVYDDVVLVVAAKLPGEIESKRELRLRRRKIRPGSVLLKYFRNVAAADLKALFPNVRVVMSNVDKLMLGIPALGGGIPILLKLYATITVLLVVVGFYLGIGSTVADKDMKTALAALSGLVALGAFIMRQWVNYHRQSLKYRTELTDNVYFRNVNNNAGIFDYLIGAAEEQECKEAMLAYYFLLTAPMPPGPAELEACIEAWLSETFGVRLAFKVGEALKKLERIGLLKRNGEQLAVLPLDGALAELRGAWDRLIPGEGCE